MLRLRQLALTYQDETQFGEMPVLHIELDYSVRPFRDVEKEYLDLFYLYSGEEQPKPDYLGDIAEAFESCMDKYSQFLNTKTGEIVSVPGDPGVTGLDEDANFGRKSKKRK